MRLRLRVKEGMPPAPLRLTTILRQLIRLLHLAELAALAWRIQKPPMVSAQFAQFDEAYTKDGCKQANALRQFPVKPWALSGG